MFKISTFVLPNSPKSLLWLSGKDGPREGALNAPHWARRQKDQIITH